MEDVIFCLRLLSILHAPMHLCYRRSVCLIYSIYHLCSSLVWQFIGAQIFIQTVYNILMDTKRMKITSFTAYTPLHTHVYCYWSSIHAILWISHVKVEDIDQIESKRFFLICLIYFSYVLRKASSCLINLFTLGYTSVHIGICSESVKI